jgi:hypothetical protein
VQVVAVDEVGRSSAPNGHSVAVPLDDRDHRIHRSRHGWHERRSRGAYRGTVAVGSPGATMVLHFTGHDAAVIGPRLRHGGVVWVRLDRRRWWRVSARGKSRARAVLIDRHFHQGRHVLYVRVHSGTVDVDAIGFRRLR